MAKESTADCLFTGEYAAELKALYESIVRLWQDHRTSPHRAGDELIYSFGSLDYVVVINQDVLGGLVEVKTKDGNVDCLMDAEGTVSCKLNTDPKEGGREGADIRLILQNTVKALELYYLRRA
ncbi:MAG: hypothetical protein HY774_16985 [Acidobacteria bacterium]|nr:hypothetical protein [Acidobacteriota bacterium]